MSIGQLRRLARNVLLPAALPLLWGTAAAAQGIVTGRVVAQGTNEPLAESRVIVVGTNVYTSTNPDGRYTLRNVPVGNQELRVLRVGFQEQKRPVVVAAGQTATVDFALATSVVKLAEVVTTATGEQRRVELGNAISAVNAAKRTEAAPVTDMASLLVAQSPGVQVLPGNTTGTGARIRIRGVNSLTLANDPIYIIDGVRMTSDNSSQSNNIFTGGAIQSRAQDINPEEIETIEVVKGPSAATLYGTDAANGVIVITTKRGRAGDTRYTVFAEGGIIKDRNTWPTAYTLFGHAPGTSTANCARPSLSAVSAGTCVADSLKQFNLFEDPETTPLGTGTRRNVGVQVAGGTQTVRFFTSGEYEQESGIFKIPRFDIARLNATGTQILDEWRTPSELTRGSFRGNVDATLTPKLDAQFSTNFITSRSRLPQSDNNALGLLSNAFGGPGFRDTTRSSLGFPLMGYRQSTPAESFQDVATQYINRVIASANLNFRPTSWLTAHGDAGVDYTGRVDNQLCRRGTCADVGTTRLGFVQDDRANMRTITVNGIGTGTFQPREWLSSKTSVGVQWVGSSFDRNGAGAQNLTAGGTTLNAGATQFTDASYTDSKTLGIFAEEQAGIRDRLFLTVALRTDQNSAFGTNFQQVWYPKASVSYVISQEGFFPRIDAVNELRFRAAYGTSGVQPGANDALRYYTPAVASIAATDQPVAYYSTLGNPDLRPERATEFEGGFDMKLFGNRTSLEATYYSKVTKDALVGRIVPPSLGTGTATQRSNIGSVKNAGVELGITSQLVDSRPFGWDVSLNGSVNHNKLVSLGEDAAGKPIPPIVGTTTRNQAGYPLFGYWARPITQVIDRNNDGVITYNSDPNVNEVFVGDSSVFMGYSVPKYEAVLNSGFDLLNRQLRITALFDYKGGHKLLNGTERIRCQSRNNCFEAYDRSAPLWRQARAVAVREHPSRTQAGYMEDASFFRFRELGAQYTLPQPTVDRLGFAKSASLTFSVRNIHVWTDYTGLDPESNADAGSTATLPSDFQTVPPPTYFILRLNLGF